MLDEEIRFYQENLPAWLTQHKNRVVLIKGQQLIGFFDTENDALSEGARQFGLQSFLVRRVIERQPEFTIPALALGVIRASISH